jgi:hypothetical protein
VNKPEPDLSPLLPDEATLKSRRRALVVSARATTDGRPAPAWRRRPTFALAGTGALAGIVVAILLVGSGPSAETAGAKALKQTASVAAKSKTPALAPPGPGQFLYMRAKLVDLEGWLADGRGMGSKESPRYFTPGVPVSVYPDVRPALVSTAREFWISRDGAARMREALSGVDFLAAADQKRWRAAGSPPPFAFDAGEHNVHRDDSGRLVKEGKSAQARGVFLNYGVFPDLTHLPTEPEALRLALEYPGPGQPTDPPPPRPVHRDFDLIERLTTILTRPTASPALRAAAFNAIAEIPGIEVKHGVTDVAGRRGDAITWEFEAGSGFGSALIFDPRTSDVLARAEMLSGPKAAREYGVEPGTVFRETAYLGWEIVDSAPDTTSGR